MQKESQKFSNSECLEGMSSISSLIYAMEHPELGNDRKILSVLVDAEKKKSTPKTKKPAAKKPSSKKTNTAKRGKI